MLIFCFLHSKQNSLDLRPSRIRIRFESFWISFVKLRNPCEIWHPRFDEGSKPEGFIDVHRSARCVNQKLQRRCRQIDLAWCLKLLQQIMIIMRNRRTMGNRRQKTQRIKPKFSKLGSKQGPFRNRVFHTWSPLPFRSLNALVWNSSGTLGHLGPLFVLDSSHFLHKSHGVTTESNPHLPSGKLT